MADRVRADPTRRHVLAGITSAAAVALSGCGIQLEDGAPTLPLVPTRTPVPGEDALLALHDDCRRLMDLAARLPGTVGSALAQVHDRQRAVLRAALLGDGVPTRLVDAAVSPPSVTPPDRASAGEPGASSSSAPTGTPSPSAPGGSPSSERPPGPTTTTTLADAEAKAANTAARFPTVAPTLRATVAALHAQRFAAAVILNGAAPAVTGGSAGGPAVDDLAGRTTAAIYLVEVAIARSAGTQRAQAMTTLTRLRSLAAGHRALGADPEPVVGVALPFPVRGAADAARLIRTTLITLRDDHGRWLADLVTASGAAGLTLATTWLGTVEADCYRWGAALEPFPGLR
ncbi:MAG: hypothetical protein ACRCXL_08035 [Dermatophilaceae bacterium]